MIIARNISSKREKMLCFECSRAVHTRALFADRARACVNLAKYIAVLG